MISSSFSTKKEVLSVLSELVIRWQELLVAVKKEIFYRYLLA
jgi:hypothetical protein